LNKVTTNEGWSRGGRGNKCMNQTYCRVGVTLCSVVIASRQNAVTGTTWYSTSSTVPTVQYQQYSTSGTVTCPEPVFITLWPSFCWSPFVSVSFVTSLQSNLCTALTTWNSVVTTRTQHDCTSARCIFIWNTTAVRHKQWDSRLSTAQTTVKVNCNLRSQKVYVTAAPLREPLDASTKESAVIGSTDNERETQCG
jgi:hypothetical protein